VDYQAGLAFAAGSADRQDIRSAALALAVDGLHPRSKKDYGAGLCDVGRRRPDRALRRFGAAVGKVAEEQGMPTTEADTINADLPTFLRA
jgi:hypothetical protein